MMLSVTYIYCHIRKRQNINRIRIYTCTLIFLSAIIPLQYVLELQSIPSYVIMCTNVLMNWQYHTCTRTWGCFRSFPVKTNSMTLQRNYISYRMYRVHSRYCIWFNSLSPVTHVYVSVNWVIIGSGNGLSPVWRQAITWINDALLSIGHYGTNFRPEYTRFLTWKCITKCHLRRIAPFALASIKGSDPYSTMTYNGAASGDLRLKKHKHPPKYSEL